MSSSNTAWFVIVARNDYWKTICPSTYVNTTLNFSLFNYGSGLQNMSFYYGCNSASGLNLSSNSHVCNSSVTVSFLTQTQTSKLPADPVATGACQSMVPVRFRFSKQLLWLSITIKRRSKKRLMGVSNWY